MQDWCLLFFVVCCACGAIGFIMSCFLLYSINAKVSYKPDHAHETSLDHLIADVQSLSCKVERVKAGGDANRELIIEIFRILKESIENDLTQAQVLEIINSLNLPLEKKDGKKD